MCFITEVILCVDSMLFPNQLETLPHTTLNHMMITSYDVIIYYFATCALVCVIVAMVSIYAGALSTQTELW